MQVVEFLEIELLGFDCNRVATGLPETAFAICSAVSFERLAETRGHCSVTEISQCLSRKLTAICQRLLKRLRAKRLVKDNCMKMSRHDHKRVDPQSLVLVTEPEAVRDDSARFFCNEDRKPLHNGPCDVIDGSIGSDAISFHWSSPLS